MTSTLVDSFSRQIVYLRLSVTDRCDLRCNYCIPDGYKHFKSTDDWLTFTEIERLVSIFANLGVSRIRLTGGEPLTRKGIDQLAANLANIPGITDLSLSTNGTQLSRYASNLYAAGVKRLNISLDTLNPVRMQQLTGHDVAAAIFDGIKTAHRIGFSPIKINMVLIPGFNDDEVNAMAAFCIDHGMILRLIELMPVGESGQRAHMATHNQAINIHAIRDQLVQQFNLVSATIPGGGPAYYLQSPDGRFSVGFISAVSQHFCDTCNRVRLAVDGVLHLCLGREDQVNLREPMRKGASDDDLSNMIIQAIAQKPERHCFNEPQHKIVRIMAGTGG